MPMVESSLVCPVKTNRDKIWEYIEYYLGDRDNKGRKGGKGEYHWTGAKSIEWYDGQFTRDTMHGEGDYRWRYVGRSHVFCTYEGHFFANQMHGYGIMSYCDGRVFKGLFHTNIRWGPGVETHVNQRQDVGLWWAHRLVKLCWRPSVPSVVPDFLSLKHGRSNVEPLRKLLTSTVRPIGEINSAIDLLKQCGVDPKEASEKWKKLYAVYCTDVASKMCHVEAFNEEYYGLKMDTLTEVDKVPVNKEGSTEDDGNKNTEDPITYYAWNNNAIIINMMQHSYQHDRQKSKVDIDLLPLLTGPRSKYKSAGDHELDCRSLLMSCYIGHIENVVRLVNESQVYPDVADIQGNTPLMYAVCGDQTNLIRFLVEAGANVNCCNDACLTPLAIALIRLVCVQKSISCTAVLDAFLPVLQTSASKTNKTETQERNIHEWNMTRDLPQDTIVITQKQSPIKSQSKSSKLNLKELKSLSSGKSLKSVSQLLSAKESVLHKDTGLHLYDIEEPLTENFVIEEPLTENYILYNDINNEYMSRINAMFQTARGGLLSPYIFTANDMIAEVKIMQEKSLEYLPKNATKNISKTKNVKVPASKTVLWRAELEPLLDKSFDKLKIEWADQVMGVIEELLSNGADPRQVHFPQPALFIALSADSLELIRMLVEYGCDIDHAYENLFGYTALDIMISRDFSTQNLNIIKSLLESGADTSHRLSYPTTSAQEDKIPKPGPTLLHAILARKLETEAEEEIRRQLLELLLDYNCDPTAQYKGRSAIDYAMKKELEILNIFLENPKTDHNAHINDLNQSLLSKMFYLPFFKEMNGENRLSILKNMLFFGCDPLIPCQCEEAEYKNLFVFAKEVFLSLEPPVTFTSSKESPIENEKPTKGKPPLKEEKSKRSSKTLKSNNYYEEYKQAVDLASQCIRVLHARWLRAKLLKTLGKIVDKFKHRWWHMIMQDIPNENQIGLWLTPQNCLEIWNILKETKHRFYNDQKTLKYVLCIVQYYHAKYATDYPYSHRLTIQEMKAIENEINDVLHGQDHHDNLEERQDDEVKNEVEYNVSWTKSFVKPELFVKADKKFNICFECHLPLEEEKIRCTVCELISFCSMDCLRINMKRPNCHPCSEEIKQDYVPLVDSVINYF